MSESPEAGARGSVRLRGCDLVYGDDGEGAVVVLIHGLGMSKAIWSPVRAELADRMRVVAVDLRGAGETRELERDDLTLAVWAADIHELVAALGTESPILVGHSLGASVALKCALEHPDAVAGLVLLGADANLASLGPRMLSSAGAIEELGLPRWVDERWAQNPPFSRASLERAPELLARYRELLLLNDAGDYVRTCRAIAAAEDVSGRLHEVERPAVVVVGGADDRTLPEHGRELARLLPRARLVELPGVGHTIPLEAPRETAVAVLSLVEGTQ